MKRKASIAPALLRSLSAGEDAFTTEPLGILGGVAGFEVIDIE